MVAVINRTSIQEVFQDVNFDALAYEYAEECRIQGLPLPDAKLSSYITLDESDCFNVIAAYNKGLLIGFLAMITPIIPHYGVAISVVESVFVAKEHRKTGAGMLLIRESEKIAKGHKSSGLLISTPSRGDLSKVLPCTGYTETNTVFFKGFE